MSITVVFDPPLPSDNPATFNQKAFTLLGDLNTWSTQANQVAVDINADSQNAATNASNAAASASAAATSASQAAASAADALNSANAASASATAAANSFDAFDDRYLGSKTSDPTVDNDGNALLTGALYWNTTVNEMRVWDGSSWRSAAPDDAANISYHPSGTGAVARTVQDKLREVVSVKDFGAVGDGVTDDTAAIKNAAAALRTLGGGRLIFGEGKTYKVWPTGGTNGDILIDLQNTKGVTLEGRGAKILAGNVSAVMTTCIDLNASQDVFIQGLSFESGNAVLSSGNGIDWIVARNGAKRILLSNLEVKYGRVGFAARGIASGEGTDADRARDIVALNCNFTSVYYPLSFQGAGDNFFARGIYTRGCGRSYFPWNVKNHDVWLDSQHGGPFTDVLLKVYGRNGWYSRLENIKLYYHSDGRYAGSGNQNADEAMIAMDCQLADVANGAAGFIQNIDITFNVEPRNVDKNQSIFVTRKFDGNGNYDTTGRGHQIIDVVLRGMGRSMQNLLSTPIKLFSVAGMSWAGDTIYNVVCERMSLTGVSGTAISLDGEGVLGTTQGFTLRNLYTDGTLVKANMSGKHLGVHDSALNGIKAVSNEWQSYTPSWTGATTNPVIGNGTLSGAYTVHDGLCTVIIRVTMGSTTTFGSGTWSFSLPFAAAPGSVIALGSARVLDAGTNWKLGASHVGAGASTVQATSHGDAGQMQSTLPMAWAAGDVLELQITYPIA